MVYLFICSFAAQEELRASAVRSSSNGSAAVEARALPLRWLRPPASGIRHRGSQVADGDHGERIAEAANAADGLCQARAESSSLMQFAST